MFLDQRYKCRVSKKVHVEKSDCTSAKPQPQCKTLLCFVRVVSN